MSDTTNYAVPYDPEAHIPSDGVRTTDVYKMFITVAPMLSMVTRNSIMIWIAAFLAVCSMGSLRGAAHYDLVSRGSVLLGPFMAMFMFYSVTPKMAARVAQIKNKPVQVE